MDYLPLVVLTAGNTLDTEALASVGLPSDFPVEEIQAVWVELQEELASLSTESRHLIVEDSGHAIHLERPELVVDAIQEVLTLSCVD